MSLFKAIPIDYRGNSPRFDYKEADTAAVLLELARLLAIDFPHRDQLGWLVHLEMVILFPVQTANAETPT